MALNAVLPAVYDAVADYAEGIAKHNNLEMPNSWKSNLSQISSTTRKRPHTTELSERAEKLLRQIDNEQERIRKATNKARNAKKERPVHRGKYSSEVSRLISETKKLNDVVDNETKLVQALTEPIPPLSLERKLAAELTQQTGRARKGGKGGKGRKKNRNPKVVVVQQASAPVAFSGSMSYRAPTLNGKRSVTISGVERSQSIYGTVTTSNTSSWINTNPGSTTFPWLNTVANSFARYKWKKLKVYYVSAQESSTLGKIAITTSYNPNASGSGTSTTNLNAALNNPNSKECRVWENTATNDLTMPDWKKDQPKFIQNSSVTSTSLNTANNWGDYNYMNLYFWQQGTGVTEYLGDFWFEYVVELFDPTPAIDPAVGSALAISTAATTAAPFGATGSGYANKEAIPVASSLGPVLHKTPTAAQLFFADSNGTKIYFNRSFEGLFLIQYVSGALTGESGSTEQMTLTSNDPEFASTLLYTSIGTDKKRNLYAIKITDGNYLTLALGGGLSIDTTAKVIMRFAAGNYDILTTAIDS